MAAQVLSGSSNVSYTNNTGQNVRIIINYMARPTSLSWGGVTINTGSIGAIGRNLAFSNGLFGASGSISSNNMAITNGSESSEFALPTEIMIAAGQTFSASCNEYNVVVIPEAG